MSTEIFININSGSKKRIENVESENSNKKFKYENVSKENVKVEYLSWVINNNNVESVQEVTQKQNSELNIQKINQDTMEEIMENCNKVDFNKNKEQEEISNECDIEDDKESVYSIQNKETDYAKDTSDTESDISDFYEDPGFRKNIIRDCDKFRPDKYPKNIKSDNSESESDYSVYIQQNGILQKTTCNEIWRFKKRKCCICNIKFTKNNLPFCNFCYIQKRSIQPPIPSKRKKILNLKQKSSLRHDEEVNFPRRILDANWVSACEEKCIICRREPKNGIFLHNTGGHMCSCYSCAVLHFNKTKFCPCCNRKVKNVVKAFIV